VNVFFAGGQSNAKAVWATAIADGLKAGYGTSLVMAHTNHSGEGLANWFTETGKPNYSNDLFQLNGTSVLQTRMTEIAAAGDEPVFRGFFWFQGETDTGSYASIDAYTNRFRAMMAQLKQDLALTQEVAYCLAIIDANPDPYYDDPANTGGRTRAMIGALRTNQVDLCSGFPGSYADTRGYTRTDMWHLTTTELTRLGAAMSEAFTNAFGISLPPDEAVILASHDSDGSVFPTGVFPAQDLICGNAADVQYNGILFFPLPAHTVTVADLALTVVQNNGAPPSANLDLWGLGYQSVPLMDKTWMCLTDSDERDLINPQAVSFTKIADNVITAGQSFASGSVWTLTAAQQTNLAAFLNGLYRKGALPGDYAVLRVNPDAVTEVNGKNVRFGGSHQLSPDRRAKLTLTLTEGPQPPVDPQEGAFVFHSHASDGGVYSNGVSTATDLISGTGGGPRQNWSGIAFFPLPEQPVTEANLSLTVATFSGIMPQANIDVWGLGYQAVPTLSSAWLATNDFATGKLLNDRWPVKIADNIVTAGQSLATGAVWTPNAAERDNLKRFLNGLYNLGARPGEYAVIRMNLDAPQDQYTCGVRWGGSHQINPDRRARLEGAFTVATNRLVNPGFESGTDGTPAEWSVQANQFLGERSQAFRRNGYYSFRMAVNGDQSENSANNLNLFQNINDPGLAGKRVTFSAIARHPATDPLVTNSEQRVELRLWWLFNGAQNGFVTSANDFSLLPTDPADANKLLLISSDVPAGASGVQAMVIFRTGTVAQPSITNGSAFVDDLRVTVFEPVWPSGTLLNLR